MSNSTAYDDIISLTSEDDYLDLLGGDDVVNGGSGSDTVSLDANLDKFELVTLAGVTKITGLYGSGDYWSDTITLTNVEYAQFADQTVSLTTSQDTVTEGTKYSDNLTGTDGDDIFDSKGGDDIIDGGLGNDTVLIFEDAALFELSTLAGVTKITGLYGSGDYWSDSIISINNEEISFSDKIVSLEIHDNSKSLIIGTTRSDNLFGTVGDDIFEPWDGNDIIDGGVGTDRVLIHEHSSQFQISQNSERSYTIYGNYSAGEYAFNEIKVVDVEQVQFLDSLITILTPTVILSDDFLEFQEGETLSQALSLSLSTQPQSAVKIKIPGSEDVVSETKQIIFTKDNWFENQIIEFEVVDDQIVEIHEIEELFFELETDDPDYLSSDTKSITVSVIDNDTADNNMISGNIWQDTNRNQQKDEGEQTLDGWKVYLDLNANTVFDAEEPYVATDNDGNYTFHNVSTGTYTVRQVLSEGFSQTTPRNQFEFSELNVSNNFDEQDVSLSETEISDESVDTEYHDAYRSQIGLTDEILSKYTGSGMSVVVIDTGIDVDHSHFGEDRDGNGVSDRIVASVDFTGTKSSGDDGNGHGTHVAGIIAGSDAQFPGIVPGVDIISLKGLTDSGSGSFRGLNEALDWCIENADLYNITAINMSLGDGSFAEDDVLDGYSSEQLAALNALGVCVVSASGNSFYNSKVGVSYPSSDLNSFSIGALFHSDVGSIYRANSTDVDRLAPFSQRDDELTTVFAPGVLIPAAAVDGGLVQLSGTSMASPVVAGAVALIQDAATQLLGSKLTPQEVEELLISSGDLINDGDDEDDQVINTGLNFISINIDAAVRELEEMAGPGGYKVSVLDADHIKDIDFGVDKNEANGTTIGNNFVGTLASDIIVTNEDLNGYFGGFGDDIFVSVSTSSGMFGGEGNDNFIVTELTQLNSVNGGTGFDQVTIQDIVSSNDSELIITDLGETSNIERIELHDSQVKILDNKVSEILISNSSSIVEITSSQLDTTADSSAFAIKSSDGADNFFLQGNISFGSDVVAWNVSSDWQTGTNEKISIKGKLGYSGVINGAEGADNLYLSGGSDAFFLHDAVSSFHGSLVLETDFEGKLSTQRFTNIENIYGGSGDDVIDLTSPNYRISDIDMEIFGEGGDDVIWGSNNSQSLHGGSGDDILFGGSDDDLLSGGIGSDVFEFVLDSTNGHDTIMDYSSAENDVIKLHVEDDSKKLSTDNFQSNTIHFEGGSILLNSISDLAFNELLISYEMII
jgi:subtilisin family serine protease/Ca2+-binding RTX toxin-like protein